MTSIATAVVNAADESGVLTSGALDLVVISTPHHTHAPIARAALAADCHVVVDKPFATTAAEARELDAIAAHHGRLAMPFQNRRWDADMRTLQRLLADGALGDVHRFESRYERWLPTTPKPRWLAPGAAERGEVHRPRGFRVIARGGSRHAHERIATARGRRAGGTRSPRTTRRSKRWASSARERP